MGRKHVKYRTFGCFIQHDTPNGDRCQFSSFFPVEAGWNDRFPKHPFGLEESYGPHIHLAAGIKCQCGATGPNSVTIISQNNWRFANDLAMLCLESYLRLGLARQDSDISFEGAIRRFEERKEELRRNRNEDQGQPQTTPLEVSPGIEWLYLPNFFTGNNGRIDYNQLKSKINNILSRIRDDIPKIYVIHTYTNPEHLYKNLDDFNANIELVGLNEIFEEFEWIQEDYYL